MSRITIPLPNLLGGVSQQGERRRLPGQMSRMVNAWASPIDGLRKRHPTDHVALIEEGVPEFDVRMHTIVRGTEKYLVLLGSGTVDVFTDEGVPVPVRGPSSPYTPDFSYLDQRTLNELEAPETLGAPWQLLAGALVPEELSESGPLGFGAPLRVGVNTGILVNGAYRQALPANDPDARRHFSVYVRQVGGASASRLMSMVLKEEAPSSLTIQADFAFSLITPGLLEAFTTVSGCEARAVDVGGGWWRCEMSYQPTPGNLDELLYAELQIEPRATGVDSELDIFGPLLVISDTFSFDFFPPYVRGSVLADIRATTVQDFTFVTNAAVPVLKGGARSEEASGDAFIWIRQGAYSAEYRVTAQTQAGALRTAVVETWNGTSVGMGEQSFIETQRIANWLGTLLGGFPEFNCTDEGNVVRVQSAGGAADPIVLFEVSDSFGGSGAVGINGSVAVFSDLPLTFVGGERIRVSGDPTAGEDDYWVQFEADDESTATLRDGKWRESNAPDSLLELDASTMPHQLVRRFDDVTGTITGSPRAIYFEFGEATWDPRRVGDDDSNRFPSFASTDDEQRFIRDVFFYRGRLGVLSGINVVLAAAGDAFNFFRTTTRTIVDSDRVDAEASHRLEGALHAAIPMDERLILFGERTIFALTGQPLLTPTTVEIAPVLELPSSAGPLPVGVGRSILFATKHGDYSALRELFPLNERNTFDTANLTQQAPRYVLGAAAEIAALVTEEEMVVAVRTNEDPRTITVYKAFSAGGRRLQSAVWQYALSGDVQGIGWIEERLFFVLVRGEQLAIESMRVGALVTDDDSDLQVCLDRRVTDAETAPSYDGNTGVTSYALPYDLADADRVRVVTRATPSAGEGGMALSIEFVDTTAGANVVRVEGNTAAVPVWIGETYDMLVEPGRPSVTQRTDEARVPVLEGGEVLLGGALYVSGPLHLDIRVAPRGADEWIERLRGEPLDSGPVLGTIKTDGQMREFSILAEPSEVLVTFESGSHLATRLESLEWYMAKRQAGPRAR